MAGWRQWLGGLLPERALAVDSSILFSGFTLQLFTQIGWLVLALRFLGPEGYGLFVGLTAATIAVSYMVGPGCEQLLIRRVAADRGAMRRAFGQGLIAIALTGLPIGAVLLLVLPAIGLATIGTWPLAAILVADLVFGRIMNLSGGTYIATGRAARQSTVLVAMGLARLAAIALAGFFAGPLTLAVWAWWYVAASLVGTVVSLTLVVRDHGVPRFSAAPTEWRDGMSFALEATLQASAADLDKPIVLALAGPEAAGFYAAASRIVGTLSMPLRALGYAVYGRLFRMGVQDRGQSLAYALRVLPVSLGLGLAAAAGVLLFADLVPLVFGPAYDSLPYLLRLFCLMPLAMAAVALGADVLSATNLQWLRLMVAAISLMVTLAACWIVTPLAGVEGTAIARVAITLATALAMWLVAWRALRRS